MNYRDKLLLFNSHMLLNKREVVKSFEEFILHHYKDTNEEDYSDSKREVLLALCEQFKKELLDKSIPNITKNWLYYDYCFDADSIRLELCKCDEVEFDEDGEISTMTSTAEYTLLKVTCEYLTVEQYAQHYGVTDTTVRQWIRRGKLRTAKKVGRDWLIPALADKPKRGFTPVTYFWTVLPAELVIEFPILNGCNQLYIYQDEKNKGLFHCIAGDTISNKHREQTILTVERERLELALISTVGITTDEDILKVQFVPEKKNTILPVLSNETVEVKKADCSAIIVKADCSVRLHIDANSPIGGFTEQYYPEPYIHPVHWSFFMLSYNDSGAYYEALDSGEEFSLPKIGTIWGHFIQCSKMLADGYDPTVVCDDESADLGTLMSALSDEGAPLNEDSGDPSQDVFYIGELEIDEAYRKSGLDIKILRELPYSCKQILNSTPDLVTYNLADDFDKTPDGIRMKDQLSAFYKSNGFAELSGNHLLYAFTCV